MHATSTTHRKATPEQILAALQASLRRGEARRLAAAIRGTVDRHRDGYVSHRTMKQHLGSLWGTVDARGLRVDVELLLTAGGAR
jgi:hypothetical protein